MIYADYAATTPLDPQVLRKMLPYLVEQYYNPSALYPQAQAVRSAIEEARKQVSALICARNGRILFTSGGTESDNLAFLGTALHPAQKKRHIITSSIEHHAVLESCHWLETCGFHVTYLPVDTYGRVAENDLKAALTPDTFLVSIMWVNNELGTIQPVSRLAQIAHEGGALFHTDAVQAACTQVIRAEACGVDLLSLSSHKIYGPKGCGALYVRDGVLLSPMNHGGQQESGLRGGTENVSAIVGMGAAAKRLADNFDDSCAQLAKWKSRLLEAFSEMDGLRVDSPPDITADSIVHLSFKDAEAEGVLFWLGRNGVQVSIGAACNTLNMEPTHVIRAIGLPQEYARGSIRLSLGNGLDDAQIEQIIEAVKITLRRFQNYGGRTC